MNVDLLGYDYEKDFRDITAITRESSGQDKQRDVGGVIETGIKGLSTVLSSFFGYKTAELNAGQPLDPNRTAYDPDSAAARGQSTDNRGQKTALIIGGSALAAVVAIAALR